MQRTTWRNASLAIDRLRAAGLLNWRAVIECNRELLEHTIRPAGFFRLKAVRLVAMSRFIDAAGGIESLAVYPTDELRRRLLSVYGVGPETADAIMLYALHRPVFVDDAYARRMLDRLTGRKIDARAITEWIEPLIADAAPEPLNELHALIVTHCKKVCRPTPLCSGCTLRGGCATGLCNC